MTRLTSIPDSRKDSCPGCLAGDPLVLPGVGEPLDTRTRSMLFRQTEYRILRCGACGLVFKDSILTDESLEKLYADLDFSVWAACPVYPTERAVLKHISSLPRNSRVLDFGCSSGRLLGRAGPQIEKWGFEINSTAAREATAKGIRIVGDWDQLGSLRQTFDVVLLMDVFEHLPKPTRLLEHLAELVKPGGMLVVSTGNADCRACQIDIPNFWYFRTVQHLCMITKQYAEAFASRTGLRITSWRECSHYDVSLFGRFAQHLRQWVYSVKYRSPQSFAASVLKRLPILRKSVAWDIPPPYSASRDHAVVFFEKPAFCAK
jgi:SAM-dependent methyltransferase